MNYTPSEKSLRQHYIELAETIQPGSGALNGIAFDNAMKAIKNAAWAYGYEKGNLDGYFGSRESVNPYKN